MISDTNESTAASAASEGKTRKKGNTGARRAHVAPKKTKAGKQATPPKKAPKGRTKAAKPEARGGSKTARILDLLKRPGGVTSKELMKATGWQPHSVRGFLSGTLRKKMRLAVVSTKGEEGERSYSIKV